MADLRTEYMGLHLKNPLVASASPLSESSARIRQLEDAGIAAVVLPSLFEEQLQLEGELLDRNLSRGAESFAESLSFFPDMEDYNLGPETYCDLIRQARTAVSIPVIGSLNGCTPGGWLNYALMMEQAGAHAIELNLYALPADPNQTGAEVENQYCEVVEHVKQSVNIPVAVKLSQFFSAPANIARRIDDMGADALVLFNRFYQPDFDIEQLEVTPQLTLSQPYELLLRLHWVAIMYGHVQADLAVTGGIHGAKDVLKCMMAGASVAMMTSMLLHGGVEQAGFILDEMESWMDEHEYKSIRQMRGSMSYRSVPNPSAFERNNYMRVLSTYAMRMR
jgi:dihydroorotate dehydrogenase (fumarate)